MPGIIVKRHGGEYIPDTSGVDKGASPSKWHDVVEEKPYICFFE